MKRPKGYIPHTRPNPDPIQPEQRDFPVVNAEASVDSEPVLEDVTEQPTEPLDDYLPLLAEEKAIIKQAHLEVKQAKREVRAAKKERKKRERQEKRRFTAHNRGRRIKILAAFGAIVGLAVFVSVGVFTPVMAIKNIEVIGSEKVSNEKLLESLQPFAGTPIALIDQNEVAAKLQAFPQIERFSIRLIPPDTLSVVVIERVAALGILKKEKYKLYDAAGVQLETVKKADKPKSVPQVKGKAAKVQSPEFFAAAAVVSELPSKLRKKIVFVEAETAYSVGFLLKSGIEVVWGSDESNAYKLLVLESILEALAGEEIKKIDVSSPKSPVFE